MGLDISYHFSEISMQPRPSKHFVLLSDPATKDRMEKYCNNTALVIDCPADSQASTIGAIQVFFKYFFHLTPPGAL